MEILLIFMKILQKIRKKKYHKRKRGISKKNDDINEIIQCEEEKIIGPKIRKKRKIKVHKTMTSEELANILINKKLTDSQQIYYMKLFLEKSYRG